MDLLTRFGRQKAICERAKRTKRVRKLETFRMSVDTRLFVIIIYIYRAIRSKVNEGSYYRKVICSLLRIVHHPANFKYVVCTVYSNYIFDICAFKFLETYSSEYNSLMYIPLFGNVKKLRFSNDKST